MGIWGLFAGALLLAWALFSIPPYRLIPFPPPPAGFLALTAALAGLLLMVLGFRNLPSRPVAPDFSPALARWLLLGVIVLGFAFRIYRVGHPIGWYFDDHAFDAIDTRNMLDLKDYHLIFPVHYQNPLYNYWILALWSLVPEANGLVMQRVAATLMEMMSLWFLYLLGRELSGRRTGVLLALLAAVSKPLLREVVHGMLVVTCPFALSLALLFTVRFLKKPGWKHALLWGFSVALLMYAYTALRPLVPFLILLVLVWFLLDRSRALPARPASWILGSGVFIAWMLMFILRNGALQDPGVLKPFVSPAAWSLYAFLLAWPAWRVHRAAREGKGGGLVLRWAAGLLLATALMAPLIFHVRFPQRGAMLSLFSGAAAEPGVGNPWTYILGNLVETFRAFFMGRGLFHDGILDFHDTLLVALGAACFLARPTRGGFLMALAVPAAASGYILTWNSHHSRAIPAVLPLLALAALGLDRLAASWVHRRQAALGWTLLAFFLAWHAWASFDRVQLRWARQEGAASAVASVLRAESPQRRVYYAQVAQFDSPLSQSVISEGHPFWILQEENPIVLEEGDRVPDVVVIVSGTNDPGTVVRLRGLFPEARFEDVRIPSTPPPGPSLIVKMTLPGDQVPTQPGRLFHVVRRSPGEWRRQRSHAVYGLNRGVIALEDVTTSFNAPLSIDGRASLRLTGNLRAPQNGTYRFSSTAKLFVVLDVDGKRVLDLRPRHRTVEGEKSVVLQAGDHRVEYQTFFDNDYIVPEVFVEGPGLPRTSLESAGR